MRPQTLLEVSRRVIGGVPFNVAVDEFLDEFYGSATADVAYERLVHQPRFVDLGRYLDPYLGATARYLSFWYCRRPPPAWVDNPWFVCVEPTYPPAAQTDDFRHWLGRTSPAEFAVHGLYVEPYPLRRKLSERPRFLENAHASRDL